MHTTDQAALYLGIDGGGTKCKVRLEDAQGNFLGEGMGGPANLVRSLSDTIAAILEATAQALQQAGLGQGDMARIHAAAGLAGANVPGYKTPFVQWPHPFASLHLTTDMDIACIGAHLDEDGGVIIVGTGFCAGVRIGQQITEFGGYGLFLGDQASAAALGLQAIHYCLRVLDGLEAPGELSRALLANLQCTTAEALAAKAIAARPDFYAQLAPQIFTLAAAREPVAVAIIERAASYIERYCEHLLAQPIRRLSLVGGVAEAILPWLTPALRAQLQPAYTSPEQGALRLARALGQVA